MNPDGGNTDFEAKSSDSGGIPQNILNEPSLSIEDNRNNRASQLSRRDLEITDPNSQLSTQKPQINPYLSTMFKEKDLLSASNAYHRLDKSQHFLHNRAYAQTILNDLKRKNRINEFADKMEYGFGTEAQ